MQLTSQTATKSGGPANGLMNLTYGYQASAGQMGAGSTAGNAGQLMTISGTMGAVPCKGCPDTTTTETASYTYDVAGRLVTSNQTSNGSSARRRFAYDRWGNRTGMWDSVSGGNQIQNVVLQQSGGAPTNRLTSVTTSGVTANYSYDAAGNVTNDGVHAYTYDAENRVVSVDSGATATYAYDTSNQRCKKVTGGATTHYIWLASQVIAEHNGDTGASIADYVYSGRRMIAKVAGLLTQLFLSDRLSVRMTLDTSGNVSGRQAHFPFGEDFGESGPQEKHHFTSYERDSETGTDYAVNRQYNQSVGRFNRVDPMPMVISNPQSLNRYTHAANNPIDLTDPLGLQWEECETVFHWSIWTGENWYTPLPTLVCHWVGGGQTPRPLPRERFDCSRENVNKELDKLEGEVLSGASSKLRQLLDSRASNLALIAIALGDDESMELSHRFSEQITAAVGNFHNPPSEDLISEADSIRADMRRWLKSHRGEIPSFLLDGLDESFQQGVALSNSIGASIENLKQCNLKGARKDRFDQLKDRWEGLKKTAMPLLNFPGHPGSPT